MAFPSLPTGLGLPSLSVDASSSEELTLSQAAPNSTTTTPGSGFQTPSFDQVKSFVATNILGIKADPSDLDFLKVEPDSWYKVFPYQFIVERRDAGTEQDDSPDDSFIYTLPIPPDSLTVSMVPASTVTPTLGGVIEETSKNVFWNIQLSGTTGLAVGRGEDNSRTKVASTFRDILSTTGLLTGLSNALQGLLGTASAATNVLTRAASTFGPGGSGTGVGDALASGFSLTRQPELPYSKSGVPAITAGGTPRTNGFTEIHELHRFLYAYSSAKEGNPAGYSLFFVNYKDSQKFQCILRDISIQKSANEPMLYRYRIMLQCWNPKGPDSELGPSTDRFQTDLKSVNTLANSKEVTDKINAGGNKISAWYKGGKSF